RMCGRVRGEGGGGVGGVGGAVPELGLGGSTKDNGTYLFTVPGARVTRAAVTITARRVGYKPKTARITLNPGTITQDFTLEANPLQLGEVVVTGAGTTMQVEKLGNVRNQVDSSLVQKSNESNVVQALAAKAPNVVINQSAGDPGASSKIQIRGLRTLNGQTQPLFVIDGVPANNETFSTTNFNPIDVGGAGVGGQDNGGEFEGTSAPNRMIDINPDDIENVEILKGAAAAAIYGARAANGVILITTKHGRSGQTHYELRSSGSNDVVTRKEPLQRGFSQGLLSVGAGVCNNIGKSSCLRSWGPALAAGTTTYDHSSEAFDTGHVLDNTLSASGGNDRTTFYLSGNYNNNQGVFIGPNNYFDRGTVRLNATHHLTDNFTLGGNFSYAHTRGHMTQRAHNVNGLLLG